MRVALGTVVFSTLFKAADIEAKIGLKLNGYVGLYSIGIMYNFITNPSISLCFLKVFTVHRYDTSLCHSY